MINKNTFKDYIILPESSNVPTKEVIEMKANIEIKKKKTVLVTVLSFMLLFIGSNGIAYAASGETWVQKAIHYTYSIAKGSVNVEYNQDENGMSSFSATAQGDGAGYTEYKDGRTYFVFGENKKDITDEVANDNYYMYEYTDEQDVKHVIVVGEGTFIETSHGKKYMSLWEETFYYPNGEVSSVGQLGDITEGDPAWLIKAHENMEPISR